MAFLTPSFDDIRQRYLRDIAGQLDGADVGPDSDHFIRASSVGAVAEGIYQYQAWLYRQIWPDTADSGNLERHAGDRGLTRKPPTYASGAIRVTGWTGTLIPAGLVVRHPSGLLLTVITDTPIGANDAGVVRVIASGSGVSYNALSGPVTLTSPPVGVDAAAAIVEPLAGGVDQESDAELLDRLLMLIRRPPAGGNRYDYQRWAREVPGVTAAYVYPKRRGLGTVDVVIISGDGLPSAEILAAVQRHVDEVRPVTAWDFLAFAPTIIDLHTRALVHLADGYTTDDTQPAGERQLRLTVDAMPPGEMLYLTQIEALISNLPGVIDRKIVTPDANIVPVVDATRVEWVRHRSLVLELMP